MDMSLIKKLISEFLGTFLLVFIACGVAAFTNGNLVATSLAFGLVIIAMAYTIGRISGCHINPAVSFAFFIMKKLELKDFIFYVVCQLLGAFLGGVLLFGIIKMGNISVLGDACNTVLNYNGTLKELHFGNYFGAMLVEILLTFVFIYVILCVSDDNSTVGNKAGIIIGFTLTLVHLIGINFTGTSVNPARSLGTAFAAAMFNSNPDPLAMLWVFLLSPIIGSLGSAFFYKFLHNDEYSNGGGSYNNQGIQYM